MTNWKKGRLAEQLKFFGAKKLRFISCYAKKPRIICKAKVNQSASSIAMKARIDDHMQMAALYQEHVGRGTQNSAFGFNQMAQQLQQMGLSPSEQYLNDRLANYRLGVHRQ